MNLHRISVKYFVDQPSPIDLGAIIPVFHQWIQQNKVPGLLIDVADYAHMVDGPGVLLVGHDVDYALDMVSRPGLLHRSKRPEHNLDEALKNLFQSALQACRLLEQETSLGKMRFRTDEAELVLEDRLHAPNNAAAFDEIRGGIEKLLARVYNGIPARVDRDAEDARRCLTLRIKAPGAPDTVSLLSRLT